MTFGGRVVKYLCDTNIISEIIKPNGNQAVVEWVKKLDLIYLSVINVEEVFCGLAYKNARKQMAWFEKFVEIKCTVLPVASSIAKRAGIMRGEFRQNGISRTQADLFIAATAAEHDLILATRNEKDFAQCGIVVFNPYE